MCYNKYMNDGITKMFKYMVDMDKRIDKRFDTVEQNIIGLRSIPDDVASRFSHITDEQAARNAQFDRLLEWARKVSEKTGVPLECF